MARTKVKVPQKSLKYPPRGGKVSNKTIKNIIKPMN